MRRVGPEDCGSERVRKMTMLTHYILMSGITGGPQALLTEGGFFEARLDSTIF